jgi:hypothetical protein
MPASATAPGAGTNYMVMKKAFDEGWGGVICKTLSLDSSKVRNVTPRYARLKAPDGSVMGWFDTMLGDLKRLKEEYPHRCAAPPYSLTSDLLSHVTSVCDMLETMLHSPAGHHSCTAWCP